MDRMKVGAILAATIFFGELFILVSGMRVLINQYFVPAGYPEIDENDKPILDGSGNTSILKSDILICRYFTGRHIVRREYYYSENNFMGKDECPFVIWPNKT